jgi:hypothetical protein
MVASRAVISGLTMWLAIMVLPTHLSARDDSKGEVLSVGSGKIAVPAGWRNFDNLKPNMILFRQGDGVGVPILDETRAPLQIGLTVERFAKSKESIVWCITV